MFFKNCRHSNESPKIAVNSAVRGRCCTLFFCQETIRDHLFDNLWKTCGNKKEEKLFGNQERRKEWLQVQLVKNDS